MYTSKWEQLQVGLPAIVFGYIGGLFGYLTGGAVLNTWWFHVILVLIPSCVGGIAMILNTVVKHKLEMARLAARLPGDPRPRPHLVELEEAEKAS